MKSVIEIAVRKPVTTLMVLLSAWMLGFISLTKLPVDYFPNIEMPVIAVVTTYAGAGPREVEKSVTRVVEGAASGVNNINYVESVSEEGRSFVTVHFNWGVNTDAVAGDVREKLDLVRRALPKDADSPIIFKFSPALMPIMNVALYGSDDLEYLYDLADTQVKTKIEQVDGVANIRISGGLKREVHVNVSRNRLQAYGLNIDSIATLLAVENQNVAGGSTYEGVYKFVLRTTGEFRTLDDIRSVIVAVKGGVPVKLGEVATVAFGYNDQTGVQRINGQSGVMLSVFKESGRNTVQVADGVRRQLAEIEKGLPSGVRFETVLDSSRDIRRSINNVRDSALLGAVLTVLVLMLYLWNFRTVSIIGIAIPTSVIVTMIAMYFFNVSLNIVSLAGLALGVGMMVDCSIVTLENIFHHRKKGMPRFQAAVHGSGEVIMAITASTVTTIAVFLPIIFMEGFVARIFRDLALTVSVSLAASLVVSYTLIPMLASKMVSVKENRLLKPLETFFTGLIDSLDAAYGKALKRLLKRKALLIVSTVAFTAVAAAVLMIGIGKEGLPEIDEGQFRVRAEFPVGTRIEFTDRIARDMEKELARIVGKDLSRMSTRISAAGMMNLGGGGDENVVSLSVAMTPKDRRTRPLKTVMEEVRAAFRNYPASVTVTMEGIGMLFNMASGGGGASIAIEVRGDDSEAADRVADQIAKIIGTVDGVREAQSGRKNPIPEVEVAIRREIASKVGLNAYHIAQSIKTGFGGRMATFYKTRDGTDMEVIVRLRPQDRMTIDNILSLALPGPSGKLVPLASIATVRKTTGPEEISRKDSVRTTVVTADAFGRPMNRIMEDIQRRIRSEVFLPKGLTVFYGGSFKDMRDSFAQLVLAFLLSGVLVYAIMASQFESLLAPFIIIFAIPFGAVGSFVTLLLFGKSLSIISAIGIVLLSGIVVNNGIVLLDYMNQLMRGGLGPDEAAVQAGMRRLRPVSMTTLTTILGLLPMAVGTGQGSELYSPLAFSVSGGLAIGTLFTLIFVPTAYAAIRKKFPMKKVGD